jgi:hypothetical protein
LPISCQLVANLIANLIANHPSIVANRFLLIERKDATLFS